MQGRPEYGKRNRYSLCFHDVIDRGPPASSLSDFMTGIESVCLGPSG